jgi:DNA-binding NarL/FixJ family response regulator
VREWQVVEALRDRLSTAAIAERLSVSPVTVRRHVSEIVRKLGVSDRDAAARLIESWGSPQRLRRPYRAV